MENLPVTSQHCAQKAEEAIKVLEDKRGGDGHDKQAPRALTGINVKETAVVKNGFIDGFYTHTFADTPGLVRASSCPHLDLQDRFTDADSDSNSNSLSTNQQDAWCTAHLPSCILPAEAALWSDTVEEPGVNEAGPQPSVFDKAVLCSEPGLADPVKEPGLNEAEPQPSVFDEADGSRRSDVFSKHDAAEVTQKRLRLVAVKPLVQDDFSDSDYELTECERDLQNLRVAGLCQEDLKRSHPSLELKRSEVLVAKGSEGALLDKLEEIPAAKRPKVKQRTELLLRREFESSTACSSPPPPCYRDYDMEATASEPVFQANPNHQMVPWVANHQMVPWAAYSYYPTVTGQWVQFHMVPWEAAMCPPPGCGTVGEGALGDSAGINDLDHPTNSGQSHAECMCPVQSAVTPESVYAVVPGVPCAMQMVPPQLDEATNERLLLVENAVKKLVQDGLPAQLVKIAQTVCEHDDKLDRKTVRKTVRLLLERLVEERRLQRVKDSPGTFEVTLMGEQTGPVINEEDVERLQQHIADGIKDKVEGYPVTKAEGLKSRTMLAARYRNFFPGFREGDLYESLRRMEEKRYFVFEKSPQGRCYVTSENFEPTVARSEGWYRMRANVWNLLAKKGGIPMSRLKTMYFNEYHEVLDHEEFGYVKFSDLLKDENLSRVESEGSHHTAFAATERIPPPLVEDSEDFKASLSPAGAYGLAGGKGKGKGKGGRWASGEGSSKSKGEGEGEGWASGESKGSFAIGKCSGKGSGKGPGKGSGRQTGGRWQVVGSG